VVSETLPELVHQINNPLTAIQGNAELGKLKLDDPKSMTSFLAAILSAVDRIRAINNKILQAGAPGAKSRREKVSISEVLEKCLGMFESVMLQNGISLKKSFTDFSWHVLGDRFFLEQAFANLIVNAIQAMEDAPEKALLVSTIMNEESSTLSIAIRDTGCGIPQESLNRIFEPYFTSRNQGTGLGLHVVATIVKDHHGSVEVATDVGKGTTFTVILPVGRTGHCGSGE
jgi:signal transduction histidine kinase